MTVERTRSRRRLAEREDGDAGNVDGQVDAGLTSDGLEVVIVWLYSRSRMVRTGRR